jgi:hypothetical protein
MSGPPDKVRVAAVLALAVIAILSFLAVRTQRKHLAQTPGRLYEALSSQAGKAADEYAAEVTALQALDSLKTPGNGETARLLKDLEHPSWKVRAQAVSTLGKWLENGVDSFPGAPDRLEQALDDSNHTVRFLAAKTLARMFYSPRALRSSGLMAALQSKQFAQQLAMDIAKLISDGQPELRAAGAELAGATDAMGWKVPLLKMLRTERDIPVALQCAGALARLGDGEGMKYLAAEADDPDDETRELAASLLMSARKTGQQTKARAINRATQGVLE